MNYIISKEDGSSSVVYMNMKSDITCTFCGKNINETQKMISVTEPSDVPACICDACIKEMHNLLIQELPNSVAEPIKLIDESKTIMPNINCQYNNQVDSANQPNIIIEYDKDTNLSSHIYNQLRYAPELYEEEKTMHAMITDTEYEASWREYEEYLEEENTPKQIKQLLDESIIGQDAAKKTLAVAMYNHYKRLNFASRKNNPVTTISKSNILMIGPSGSGKTLLAQTIAEILNVPFTIVDATSLTETGYVGGDVESILASLLRSCDYNIERAKYGIVFIDEIDKIARRANSFARNTTRDISGEGVQQALLKILEGTIVNIPSEFGKPQIQLDTSNILFICGGAFEGIEYLSNEKKPNQIGFNSDLNNSEANTTSHTIDSQDIMKYGIIPELVGRLPIIVQLEALKEEEMVRILTEPKNSIIQQYKELLRYDNVKLDFTDEALLEIAKLTMKNNTGARGLRSIIEDVMENIMFEIPSDKTIRRCTVTKDTIFNKIPELIRG